MDSKIKKEYYEWVLKVQDELRKNKKWISQYQSYARRMIENEDNFIKARSAFRERFPLHCYLTIGNVGKEQTKFDLRYLGQSVGTITVEGGIAKLSVSKEQSKNNKAYFDCALGSMNKIDWKNDKKAIMFRRFFTSDVQGLPRQKEHMYESALFSEIGKKRSNNKTLCNITTVNFANTRIHMKTAVRASDSGKKGEMKLSDAGGEIDLFCRRSIKNGRGESRLVVVEVKDENKKSESFDKAMKQAISYGVFIRELINSEAGEEWMRLWGMKNQKHKGFTIDCVVAMPEGQTAPSYAREKLIFDNGDALELHYIMIKKPKNGKLLDDVDFITSL